MINGKARLLRPFLAGYYICNFSYEWERYGKFTTASALSLAVATGWAFLAFVHEREAAEDTK